MLDYPECSRYGSYIHSSLTMRFSKQYEYQNILYGLILTINRMRKNGLFRHAGTHSNSMIHTVWTIDLIFRFGKITMSLIFGYFRITQIEWTCNESLPMTYKSMSSKCMSVTKVYNNKIKRKINIIQRKFWRKILTLKVSYENSKVLIEGDHKVKNECR